MTGQRLLIATVTLGLFGGCEGCFGADNTPLNDPNSNIPTLCTSAPPEIRAPLLDILFVIDNSNSMQEEQEAVSRELTAFVNEIRSGGGVANDFNVGVITTAVYQSVRITGQTQPFYREYSGQSGKLQPVPNALADGGVELGTGNERVLNGVDPELIPKFQRLVKVGTYGSGQETPLEAIRLALTPPLIVSPLDQGGNREFLRTGSRLLLVVVTDEDDCSETRRPPNVVIGTASNVNLCTEEAVKLTPVDEYVRFLKQELKNDDGTTKEVIFAAIAPVSMANKSAQQILDNNQVKNVDCPTSNQAGYRIHDAAAAFDAQLVNLDSICKSSFRDTLVNIASLANVSQVLDVSKVPDPNLLQIAITRAGGAVQYCTLRQGLEKFEATADGSGGRIFFGPDCRRRSDDEAVSIRMLCVN